MYARRKAAYDSSASEDESDSGVQERSPRGAAAARKSLGNASSSSNNNQQQQKKKKKKLPPQESIDKIWSRFSQKKFSKALSVLSFDSVPPPASPERGNELLSAGYERAAEECRRKVDKIIKECKRVNTRYRDPGWDLDWDLKWEKGNCLNSLGSTKFDINSSTLTNPSATVPKAVKRVHEIFEKPTFMKNINGSDVKQGGLGNCWLIAGFSGLANVKDGIKRICVAHNEKIGIYGFVFYRDGEWIYSIIDDKLYLKSPCWDSPSMQRDLLQQIDREDVERVYRRTYQTGSKALFFGQNKDQNETWVALVEKAYAKAHNDFHSLTGGWVGEALEDLSGGVTTELLTSDILDTEEFWDNELSRVNEEFLFGCSTGLLDGGYGNREGITEGHAYNIMEVRTLRDGTRLVKMRNPWGKVKKGNWEGAWSDGSKEWTTEVQEELGHTFGADSSFWISYEDMLRKYSHFDRTRLFRDPDWRCCQRWIGVDVPWKSVYNEKFQFKLTRDSPLVLVLSQLDARYFKGLQGQYSFRLHFRVHEHDSPGAEAYIVRSHGNYLMDRSVSIELPDMPAGRYSVFISVSAERDGRAPSVEDVVKRECKARGENEKLAQVGHAYDLANSKAANHLAELAKVRKAKDQGKASESRMKERRKLWERRHLTRDIQKKQKEKNEEKGRKLKEEKRARRAKEEEEAAVKEAAAAAKKAAEEAAAALAKKEAEETAAQKKKEEEEDAKAKDKASQADEADVSKTQGEDKTGQAETPDEDDKSWCASGFTTGANTPSESPVATPRIEEARELAPSEEKSEVESAVKSDEIAEEKSEEKSEDKAEDKTDEKSDKTDKEESEKADEKSEPQAKAEDAATDKAEDEESEDKAESKADNRDTPAEKKTPTPAPVPSPAPAPPPPPPPAVKDDSDSYSSDSPVEDWEELYSSDDLSEKPRMAAPTPAAAAAQAADDDTDDEKDPLPWNAICIVGFRVYSKDEGLELRVVMEGGQLSQDGMGALGEQDLDNAQANAGGARTDTEECAGGAKTKGKGKNGKKKQRRESAASEEAGDDDGEGRKKKEGDEFASYQTIVQKGDEALQRALESGVESEA